MANVYAVKTGNWSDITVWNTGALPTSADDVWANNFTVTIDISPTVLSIRTTATTGIVAGGSFSPSNGITLTCTGPGIVPGTTACFISNLTASQSCTVNANSPGSATSGSSNGLVNNSSGTVNVVGNIGSTDSGNGVLNNSSGIINIIGTVQAIWSNSSSAAVRNNSTGTVNITGDVNAGGTQAYGAYNVSAGAINITGNVQGGLEIGVFNASVGTVTVTGTATGFGSSGYGIVNNSSGTVTHIGSAVFGSSAGIGAGSASQVTFLTGPFIGTPQGSSAIVAFRWRWIPSVGSSYMTVPNSTATGYKNLYTSDSVLSQSGQPAASNVRSGTVYGPANELTGTCAVPAAGSVALGVPVDATTGTAVLTAANARTALGIASANLDTQLAPLTNLDATVSSRSTYAGGDTSGTTTLLSRLTSTRAGYLDNIATAAPSAVDIATAVWAAATRTLTTAIDNSATIAAAVWSYATGRTITGGTVDTLTNAPSVPSAATIASQVRTELTPELARMANAATVDTTGQQIRDAVTN